MSLAKEVMKGMLVKLLLYLYPDYQVLSKEHIENTDNQLKESATSIVSIREQLNTQIELNKKMKANLMKAASDAMYFGQEAAKANVELKKLKEQGGVLPEVGMSFDKTIENIKGMTGKARVTLLFRIAQALNKKEKETMLNYLTYRKEEANEVSKKKTTH